MSGISAQGPGAVRVAEGTRVLNERASPEEKATITVENIGDRPIQIGSHIHLPDVNPELDFDRAAAEAFRLDIPSGTSMRFEPGASRTVAVVALGGKRRVPGISRHNSSNQHQKSNQCLGGDGSGSAGTALAKGDL